MSSALFAQPDPSVDPSDTANYPHWIEMMQNQNINFYQTQRAFNLYWQNRPITKGCGYKPFKRWENFWQTRVSESGEFPPADQNIIGYQQFFGAVGGPKTSQSGAWTELGPITMPANGTSQPTGIGRINCVAFHPTNSDILFIGAPSGGLWKTTNGGSSWVNLTDQLPSLGVSSILIDPTNTNIIYIGTGDRDAGDAPGIGVYKTTDGGTNWTAVNSTMGNKTVGMMIMHPSNSSLILAATSGGIYKTSNGGSSWTLVSTSTAHFKDIVFKPNDPTTVYAATNNAFYKSTNTGNSWSQITSGLPTTGRFVIGTSAANSAYVYIAAGTSSGFTGLYRSTNSGTSFTQMSSSPNILGYEADGSDNSSQSYYDLCIAVDPTIVNVIYVGGINIWKSTNGGSSWTITAHWVGTSAPSIHADQHWLGFSPVNSRLYNGNDGGIYYTANSGTSWVEITSGLAIAQIYKMGQSALSKNFVINGYQDNGTGIYHNNSWSTEIGGDGMECIIDPTDTNYLYGALYYGDIRRSVNGGSNFYPIADDGVNGINESGAWVTPYALNSANSNTMYIGYKNVWRSTNVKASSNSSVSWTAISTFGNTSSLNDIESSPADPNLLYVSRGSTIFRSDNVNAASPTWTTLTAPATVKDIKAHPTNSNIVYITAGTNIYKSINKGLTWTSIKVNLPTVSMNALVINKNSNEGIYVGTDIGVFYKDANMSNWVAFSSGLPAAAEITELDIYYGSGNSSAIRASTYGRGLWTSDLYSIPTALPTADFTVSSTTPCKGEFITLSDQSTGVPTSWQWQFIPNNVTYASGYSASSQNPIVYFTVPGNYTVKLIATNSLGTDSITKTGYISVGNPYVAPISENFETFIVGAPGTFLNGWTFNNTGAFSWQVKNGGTSSANTGPNYDHTTGNTTGKYLYTEASSPAVSGEVTNLISPCIAIPSGANHQLSFWYHMYGVDITGLHVDIYYNGAWVNDIYTITGQQQTSNNSAWLLATKPLTSYAGSTIQIRFRVIRGGSYQGDVAIDDIAIGPPPVPNADFLASSTNTYVGIPISFADVSTNTPSSWSWSFNPSTITYINSTTSSSQNPQVTFNNSGTYAVTLIATNANGSDTMVKSNYINVSAGYSLPFSENFQTFTPGTPGSLSNDWSTTMTGNYPWTVNTGGTPSLYTGPLADHTLSTLNGVYMFTEASSAGTGNEAQLISPVINLSNVSNAELKFWYHMFGAGISALNVDIYTNTWTNIYTITGQQQTAQTSPWLQASVNLQAYVGTAVKIRFRTISNGDYRNDISIDDVLLQEVIPPTNDEPCGAISLSVGSSCSYTTFTNVNSTSSIGVPNPPCGNLNGNDVWLKFVAPASGNAIVDAEFVTGSFADGAMAVYKGTCGSMVYLNCNDDYNGSGNMPYLSLTGLTGGDTIFVRFWKYGGNGTGSFQLCVYEPPYINLTPLTKIVSSALGSTTFQVTSNQSWSASDNVSWAVVSPATGSGSGTLTVNYSANAGATRSAIISVTNGLGITKAATMTQYSSVVADFTITNPYLCLNSTSIFTNTSVNYTSSQWYIDGVQVSTSTNLNYTFTTSGSHSVKLKVTGSSNIDSISKVVFVSIPPVANAGNDTSLCASGSILLNGGVSMGINSCQYGCTIPTYCNSKSNNDNEEFIRNVELNGSITASGNLGNGYEDYSSGLFTVLHVDSTSYLYVTGFVNSTASYLEYVEAFIDWNRNGLFDEPSISLGSANFTGAHVFTGIVTVPSTAVLGKTKMRIMLKYGSAVISGCENNYSYGETEDYMVEVVGIGQTSYQWTGPGSYSANGRVNTISSATTSNGGTYTLTATDGFGCSDDDTKVVTINPIPTVSFATMNSVCINSPSFTITQGSPSGGTYFGTGVNGGVFNPSTAGIGTHTLYYVYTNSSGCGDTASQTITVNALPTVNLTTPANICNNVAAIQLTGGSPSGGTYSGTGVSAGYFNPVVAGSGIKQITYTYQDANGCSNTAQSNITVNAAPVATLSSLGTVCQNGGNINLSGGLPTGGIYYGIGVSNGLFNPVVGSLGTNTISYIYTNSNSCSDTAHSTISVVAPPTAQLNSFADVCANSNPVVLTGGTPSGGTYFGTSVNNGQFNPSVGQGVYTISYSVTNSNNCADTATNTITVNALPTVNIVGLPNSTCINNGIITLTGSPTGGTFSGNGVTGSQFNPAIAGTGNKSITYSYTNSNSCTNSTSQNIIVKSTPTVNAGTDNTINYSTTAQLAGSVSGGGNFTYLWKPTTKVVSPNSLSTSTISMTSSQLFTLVATNLSTTCSDSDQVMITVSGGPLSLNISASASQICQFDSVQLQAFAGGGTSSYNYSWTFGTTILSTISSPVIVPSATGYYKVTINDGVNQISDSVFITVNLLPTVSLGGLQDVCEGEAAFALYGGIPSGGNYSGVGITNNTFDPIIAGIGSHTITYTYTNSNNCSNSASTVLTVNPKPNVSLGNFASVCATAPGFTLNNGTPTGGIYYGTGVSGSSFSPSVAGIGTHVISYIFTDLNSCSDTAITTITVQSTPSSNAGNDTTITLNSAASLHGLATGGSGNYNYIWSPTALVISAGSANTSTVSLTTSNEFTLHVSDTQTGCSDSDKVLISVSGGNFLASFGISDTLICEGNNVQLSAIVSGGSGNYSYSWTSNPTGFTSNNYNPIFTPIVNTLFYITISDGNNQINDSIYVSVSAMPVINLGKDTLICGGGTIVLDGGPGYSDYLWSDNSTNRFLTINASMLPKGIYPYSVIVTNPGNCSNSDTIIIAKDFIPYVNLGLDDSICLLSNKVLDAGFGFNQYLWSTGDTNQIILADGQTLGLGSHNIWVQVSTKLGCANADTMKLVVENCISISEIQSDYLIKIYPNPNEGMFTIQFETENPEKVDMELLNLQGAVIERQQLYLQSQKSEFNIDISDKAKGIYFIRLQNNHIMRIERIIVK